jgi:hypothetical protein
MPLTASEVRVAGAGEVFVADEGTALPTDISTGLPVDWTGLGYVTTDGVTFTFGRDTEDLDAWQGSKLRVLTLAEPMGVAFALMQSNYDVMLVAFGGGTLTNNAGVNTFQPPAAGSNTVRAMCIEFQDGAIGYRYNLPRVQLQGEVSFTLTAEGALTFPLDFGVLDDTPDKYTIVTDDSAWDSGTVTP